MPGMTTNRGGNVPDIGTDISAYEGLNGRQGPTCKLPAIYEQLVAMAAAGEAREREPEEFLAALRAPERVQSSAIVARLRQLGIVVSHSFARRHRGVPAECDRCRHILEGQA